MKQYYIKSKINGKYMVEKEYKYLVECEKKEATKFGPESAEFITHIDHELELEEVEENEKI